MLGWRDSTIDIDLKAVPEPDELLRQFSVLKERLEINIELAAPDDFIPALPGWESEASSFDKWDDSHFSITTFMRKRSLKSSEVMTVISGI